MFSIAIPTHTAIMTKCNTFGFPFLLAGNVRTLLVTHFDGVIISVAVD